MEGVPQPYFSHLEISGVLHKLFSIFTAVYPSISTSAEHKYSFLNPLNVRQACW